LGPVVCPWLDPPLEPDQPRLSRGDALLRLVQVGARHVLGGCPASRLRGVAQTRLDVARRVEALARALVDVAAARRSRDDHGFLRFPSVKVARGRRARTACDPARGLYRGPSTRPPRQGSKVSNKPALRSPA